MRTLEETLSLYFHIYYNQRKMREIDAPDAIIESGEQILEDVANKLKKGYGVDIKKFLSTPNGQEALHCSLIKEASLEKSTDRCHTCGAYSTGSGCKKGVWEKEGTFPVKCESFEKTVFVDGLDRLWKLLERCGKCTHYHFSMEDGSTCSKNLDMDEIVCSGIERK